ncbi:hypothetical protein K2Z84_23955 [Candidatus Binatia bacterium]|nr:hypothetical protein [Candidatus Binatia bacterium]
MRRRATTRIAGLILGFGLAFAVQAAAQGGGDGGIPPGDIPEVLRARVGKPVTLLLRSGKEYGGTVAEVRGQSVVLKSLSGKEFYDALVRLDDVSAIEMRNR